MLKNGRLRILKSYRGWEWSEWSPFQGGRPLATAAYQLNSGLQGRMAIIPYSLQLYMRRIIAKLRIEETQ